MSLGVPDAHITREMLRDLTSRPRTAPLKIDFVAASFSTGSLAERGLCHTRLRELLAARESILHAHERDLLLDAADALLFDEPEGPAKRQAGLELLDALVESDRWLPEPAAEVGAALDGCGDAASVLG